MQIRQFYDYLYRNKAVAFRAIGCVWSSSPPGPAEISAMTSRYPKTFVYWGYSEATIARSMIPR